ncbi:MAG: alkaline phosphatase family protein [Phycisphaerae bacterium]|jgi:hypothetical protein|nr:alkaline phosphatase family protein [Phycisphaerae bacterium]
MSDVETLLRMFDSGRLVRPSAEAPNSVDLVRAMFSLAGGEGIEMGPGAARIARDVADADHYVFALIDGLGMNLLGRLPEDGFLRSHLAADLQAVFPSSTAPALTALATGQWPCIHGVPTWWVHLEESDATAVTLPFRERYEDKPLGEVGIRREDVFPLPSIWSRIGHSLLALVRPNIKDSIFTRYATGDGDRVGYERVGEALQTISDRISRAGEPTFAYLYLPDLDHICHEKGIDDDGVQGLLLALDKEFGDFAASLDGRARLVITADHGVVTTPEEKRFTIESGEPFLKHLRFPPTGEPSVPIFHVRPGSEQAFVGAFKRCFGDAFLLITPDDAERLKLFGPGALSPVMRQRLGTFIGIASQPAAVYLRLDDYQDKVHVGMHGGLTPAEMRVPLILA